MWLKDPTNNKRSVSLTMLLIAFIAVLVSGILEISGKTATTGPFTELLYSCIALYFGRRTNINGKLFSATANEDANKKVE